MMAGESLSSSFLSPSSPERDSERVEQYETVTSAEVVRRLQEVRRCDIHRTCCIATCILKLSHHNCVSYVSARASYQQ